jgi:hypothetical protein
MENKRFRQKILKKEKLTIANQLTMTPSWQRWYFFRGTPFAYVSRNMY